jgi:signal transduction histidine kinase
MIDENLLKNLNEKEKESLKNTLDTLISQTYVVEDEYKSLKESYQNLQNIIEQIIETLPNAIWVLDASFAIFLQNSKSKEIAPMIDFIDIEKEKFELEFENKIYLINIHKSGEKTVISATDISEQKRGERLASMGKVAAHLAHEIRNPIGAISILSSTLLRKVTTQNKPLVLEIKKSIYRVERIIKSTLLFTKGVQIKREALPLEALAEEIEEAFESYGYTKDVDLLIDFPQADIFGDLDTLAMVMQNFLYNGIDAIEESDKERGKVTFSFQEAENFDIITIKDSGAPIKDENILYEPFQTTKTKGHGLGLALSLEIVKAHQGTISLLKEEKGFLIQLQKGKIHE